MVRCKIFTKLSHYFPRALCDSASMNHAKEYAHSRQLKEWNSGVMNEPLYQRLRETVLRLGDNARIARDTIVAEEKEADGSVVTSKDREIGAELKALLLQETGIPVICEEDPPEGMHAQMEAIDPLFTRRGEEGYNFRHSYLDGSKGPTFWTVDPIDGTGNYVQKGEGASNHWGVLIGLVENGKPVFGMAYYPQLGMGKTSGNGLMVSTHRNRVVEEEFFGKAREGVSRFVHGDLLPYYGKRAHAYDETDYDQLTVTSSASAVNKTYPEAARLDLPAIGDALCVDSKDYPSTLRVLEGSAMLGARSGLAKVWDTVPFAAMLETVGLMQVPIDVGAQKTYGTIDYRDMQYDKAQQEKFPSVGAVWEGRVETLTKAGALSQTRGEAFVANREGMQR